MDPTYLHNVVRAAVLTAMRKEREGANVVLFDELVADLVIQQLDRDGLIENVFQSTIEKV